MDKVKIATAWLDCCSGCHMSFLDIDEAIVDLASKVEFARSPITDIKQFTPVDVGIVEGSVSNTENEEVIKALRANCKILMAWGDCACFGGLFALRNLFTKEEILQRGFVDTESTQDGHIPSSDELPALLDQVKPVNQVVKVDCYVPGCPPSATAIGYALGELLEGRIPVVPADIMTFD
ncbi:MAG: NADP oxidoreductase [Dehalococcoidia bacterium]|nr:NADP oxidoreductase [Dehalococcoidia bacterium]